MQVMVIGSGGREHALAWKIAQSDLVSKLYCVPGNAGTAGIGKVQNVDLAASDLAALLLFAKEKEIGLTVVGPEQPIVLGIADLFREHGLAIVAPSKKAAQLEGSKAFAKHIMQAAAVPTPDCKEFNNLEQATKALNSFEFPLVLKANGLAAGKGVGVCKSLEEAEAFLKAIREDDNLMLAADKILFEEFLSGQELSIIALCHEDEFQLLVPARDYKRLGDGNQGPNTGGMGAFAPVEVDAGLMKKIESSVFSPLLREMQKRQMPFSGILYAGLMIVDGNPFVLEFNVRFGDPETQPLLHHMQSDLVPHLLALAKGEICKEAIVWRQGISMAVVLASGGYPLAYKTGLPISGIDQINENHVVFHAGTNSDNGELVTSGGRVLAVVGSCDDVGSLRSELMTSVQAIQFAGKIFRSDIGS